MSRPRNADRRPITRRKRVKKLFCTTLAGLALGLTGTVLAAEKFPSRPIRLVVPFPPGGNVDVFARVL